MKNNKASGWDGIPADFWKVLCNGEQGIGILTNMFNKIKNRKQFPLEWKTAITHPSYKGRGDQGKPWNYRGNYFYRHVVKCFREFWQGD
jgi:hypothetical protein